MTVFTGTAEDDIFTGGELSDTASGGGGNDRLSGGGGGDVLAGNAGADVISGGDGNDWLFSGDASDNYLDVIYFDMGTEVDVLTGGAGDDHLFVGYGDSADGGANDAGGDSLIISLFGAPRGQTIDFNQSVLQIGGGKITGMETVLVVQGSDYGDTLTMGSNGRQDDKVYGMGGNDHIIAGTRTELMDGGSGNDVLDARATPYMSVYIYGGDGNDTIYGNNVYSFTDGGDGNDVIYASGQISGGSGDDQIFVQRGNSGRISGGTGNDKIVLSDNDSFCAGNDGADTITGGSGDDSIYSGNFQYIEGQDYYTLDPADDMGLEKDVIAAGGGDDRIAIGYGDSADGGSGSDTLSLSLGGLQAGVAFTTAGLVSGAPFTLGGGTIRNIETLVYLRGTEFNDTLTLATQETLLEVNAGAGDDVIISNASSVSVMGGAGNDRFISGIAGDTFDGGEGIDTIDYSRSTTAVTVDLSTGVGARGDTLLNVENVLGSRLNDTIIGDSGANVLNGGAGADVMAGGAGDDTYYVDNKGDRVVEAAGDGTDTVISSVTYTLGDNIENLTLSGSADRDIRGNALDNTLIGNSGDNVIRGGEGADLMIGGEGDDRYYVDNIGDRIFERGAQGTDWVYSTISWTLGSNLERLKLNGEAWIDATGNTKDNNIAGNAGRNVITGGLGADTMSGKAGSDTFVWRTLADSTVAEADLITDLNDWSDKLDFRLIDGDVHTAGVQGFDIVDAFSGKAGELVLSYDAASDVTALTVDVNGDGVADMLVNLTGNHESFDRFLFGGG